MKFVNAKPKAKKATKKVVVDAVLGRLEVPSTIEKWQEEHRGAGHGYQVTSSWCGMCWGGSRNYYEIYCGCGSRVTQRTQNSECIVESCEPKPNPMNYPVGTLNYNDRTLSPEQFQKR